MPLRVPSISALQPACHRLSPEPCGCSVHPASSCLVQGAKHAAGACPMSAIGLALGLERGRTTQPSSCHRLGQGPEVIEPQSFPVTLGHPF